MASCAMFARGAGRGALSVAKLSVAKQLVQLPLNVSEGLVRTRYFAAQTGDVVVGSAKPRALNYASKPKVELFLKEELGQRYAVIGNVSPHRAEGLILAWRLVDGVEGTRRIDVLDGMSLTSKGLSFGHRGPMHSVSLPGFIPGPGTVERLWLRYLGTTGPTEWVADFEFGPGISEEDRFDHRYYRARRLVTDREVDQMTDSIRFQFSTLDL